LPLGPHELGSPLTNTDYQCLRENFSTGSGTWFSKSFSYPSYKYTFQLSRQCEYQFKTPEGDLEWETVRDVNSWFEQMAKTIQRNGHSGYKVSENDVVYTGLSVPNATTDVTYENITGCPEEYCVQVSGPAVGRKEFAAIAEDKDAVLLYAFSHAKAYNDFKAAIDQALRSTHNKEIFLTNHFMRCGCESFCYDQARDDPAATCYVEDQCGVHTFQIAYQDAVPEDKRVSWAKTGTTKIMDWFSECASAMYGCEFMDGSSIPLGDFNGTLSRNPEFSPLNPMPFPKTWMRNDFGGQKNVYGLGGAKRYGFPNGSNGKISLAWTCPTKAHMRDLGIFGKFVSNTGYMQDAGLTNILPKLPCEPEVINPPEEPELPEPAGPNCEGVKHNGKCIQLPGGTCYTRAPNGTCPEVELVFESSSDGVSVFADSDEWMETCISNGTFCGLPARNRGHLTYNGAPQFRPVHEEYGWRFIISNQKSDGFDTYEHTTHFLCQNWEGAYGAANFTRFMDTNNLFTIEPVKCTASPTSLPSESPTISAEPTAFPSMAPTVCSESYLDSDHLNINLAIDLSFSTYEKTFSAEVDIGDVNGDGKGNTILDAQVVAIEELLKSIQDSSSLNNANCEIHIISFETDAIDHGTWRPLSKDGSQINTKLMDYIKKELRAPTSSGEVYDTNNGYTNFDAALDLSVAYFEKKATPDRSNLLVFLSDGEPNVRGDGDDEMYCADAVNVWFADTKNSKANCADLGLAPGERHTECRGEDPNCVPKNRYQDCVRGPNNCLNAAAATQYDSEIAALTKLNVERLAIGVGDESNVQSGSALWMIDNNPAKDLGVLPVQALNLEELSSALKNLCILNTDSPTQTPSGAPTNKPTVSPAPSAFPTDLPSTSPTDLASAQPSDGDIFVVVTPEPTSLPSEAPSTVPTSSPSAPPTPAHVPEPTSSPSSTPSNSPVATLPPIDEAMNSPTIEPTPAPSVSPITPDPSSNPVASSSASPTASPSFSPTSFPTVSPTITSPPTFFLPDCYDEPKLIKRDSSDIQMCYYNPDMVQINAMNNTSVTIQINNVWTKRVLPDQLRVFVNSNGANSVQNQEDGFQCLDNEGENINIVDDNEINVECYQDGAGGPWLAMIDVIITDENIKSNDIQHPCDSNKDPILNSCAWRVVVPCDYEDLCSEEPSSSPTASPTYGPTVGTMSPTTATTSGNPVSTPGTPGSGAGGNSLSGTPTVALATDEPTFATDSAGCPEDIVVDQSVGVTPFPNDAIRIVSQDSSAVKVALTQTFSSSNSTIDSMYYQYDKDAFNNKCYEDDNVAAGESIEITIQCSLTHQVAMLEVWIADALAKDVLSELDNAVIPECCHPTNPKGTPTTKYLIEIKCVTACPELQY